MAMKLKLRIKAVRLDKYTFEEQCDFWRQITMHDRRHLSGMPFARWAKTNIKALQQMVWEQNNRRTA